MKTNKADALYGLYGSSVSRARAVGYCRLHKGVLTVRTLKKHDCLRKQCRHLEKYTEHDFWRQRAQRKAWRKARKESLRKQIYSYGG